MAHEYDVELLREKVVSFNLQLPVYIDNTHQYWQALNAQAWPTIYLIDKGGFIRYIFRGETHKHFSQARIIERYIINLLEEDKFQMK